VNEKRVLKGKNFLNLFNNVGLTLDPGGGRGMLEMQEENAAKEALANSLTINGF
jgi:hypothetical protein